MKVLCVFPIFKHETKIPEILVAFKGGGGIGSKLEILGASKNPEFKFTNPTYRFVGTDKELEVVGTKGESITDCIKNCGESPDCVIMCDGSGKIPYTNITDIFKLLISDSSMCCAMINRVGFKAIPDDRYIIERFEIFSICKFLNHTKSVPDGQGGLWGYRHGILCFNGTNCEITLTAKGYDIELDLLSEVLQNKLQYSFLDVNMPDEKIGISRRRQRVARSDKFQKSILYLSRLLLVENNLSIEKRTLPPEVKRFADILSEWGFLERTTTRKGKERFVIFLPIRDGEHIFLRDLCDFVLSFRILAT